MSINSPFNEISPKALADRWILRVIIPIVVIFIFTMVYLTHKANLIDHGYQFNGPVDSVTYDEKGKATIIIRKHQMYLGDNNWDFDHNRIQKGDSMIKKRGSMIIKLIKPDGRVILEGEN
ncbi:hypothetical protein SAMN05216490_1124 [Mucilaginibacter mallensis]|uniref:Uncharacterized protein n=1 Tax=Mucilaginibacter mallensis TaxID=652787 RepID=A0A1H1S295_MUCMA|nr:hypothetical protein [Mucilaginibacter mallensis]SDS42134.1 hypothetical protein SAMN05216490_1124 [Mucilaginibacter mallensis]